MNQEKPPRLLPSGKANPEYNKWYRSTEVGKAALKKYNASDKAKDRRKKYLAGKGKTTVAKARAAKYKETFPNGRLVCVECKSAYDKMAVVERGWRRIGMFNCLCDLCA
jgi:hypothetical protein